MPKSLFQFAEANLRFLGTSNHRFGTLWISRVQGWCGRFRLSYTVDKASKVLFFQCHSTVPYHYVPLLQIVSRPDVFRSASWILLHAPEVPVHIPRQTRSLIQYALEINDPDLGQVVRRVEAAEMTIDHVYLE